MLISTAYATTEVGSEVATPDMKDTFITNMGLIAVMFLLFYVILIRPQQKRMKEQRNMLSNLKKGDKVVTGGGLYATVSKIINDDQVEIDLGGVKVTAMRYTLQNRLDDVADIHTPVNDSKTETNTKKTKVIESKAKAEPAKVEPVAKPAKVKAVEPKVEKTKATPKTKTATKKAAPKKTTPKK